MVQMGLTPSEALRAYNFPCSKQKLSYAINRVALVTAIRSEARECVVNTESPLTINLEDETSQSLAGSSITNSTVSVSGNNDSWWNRCVKKNKITEEIDLTKNKPIETVPIDASSTSSKSSTSTKSTIRVSPSFASKRRSINILNKKIETERYNKAMVEALRLLHEMEDAKMRGKKMPGCTSMQSICNLVNEKYLSANTRRITRTSLRRYSNNGHTTARPRGPKPKVSDTLIKAVGLHASMMQVSGTGEAKPRQLKSLINATTKGTCHEGQFSQDYAYTKVLSKNATTMEASSGRTQEDIRGQWTTYEKMHLWFQTTKKDLLKLGLAIDKPVFDSNNNMIAEVYIADDCKARMINFDETDHPLSSEDDKGGPRAQTYTNPSLPRPGGSSTRGHQHTTGVYGTTALGEVIPPLYIFDSSAQTEDGLRVNERSVNGLPKVCGKFGCPTVETYSSFIAVRNSGSMDEGLFQEYIENVILPLYQNIGTRVVRDEKGRLILGPVWVNCDSGPGRLAASYNNIAWRTKMKNIGLNIGLGCPNGTSVGQVMDDLFEFFKGACRLSTQDLFNDKVYERMLKIRKRNENSSDLSEKIPAVVALHQEDIPIIVNGRAGDPIEKRPFNKCFTPSRIKK